MQIGTRWRCGVVPPRALPPALLTAIRAVEEERATQGYPVADWSWTLTSREGSPVAELDDGTALHYRPSDDTVTVSSDSED